MNEIKKLTGAEAPCVKIGLSIEEAVRASGLGRTRLYSEISSGRLRAVKCGKRTIVPVTALHEWITALKPVSNSETAA
jgi:excisionase family DNA binding protein